MSYFATDAEISARYFYGETVPGDNTILEATHTSYKDAVENFVKALVGIKIAEAEPSDDFGLYKELFLELYGQKLRGEQLNPPDYLLYQLRVRSTNVPLRISNQWKDLYDKARTIDEA
jgi:hypothetical protein